MRNIGELPFVKYQSTEIRFHGEKIKREPESHYIFHENFCPCVWRAR